MSEEISKSKQKRLNRVKERQEQHRKAFMSKFWAVTIPLLIILAIFGLYMYQQSLKINYSKYIAADGTIEGINIDEYCTTTYEQMSFSKAELTEPETTIQADILKQIEDHGVLVSDNSVPVDFGTKVKVAYTATCEGSEYESFSEAEGGKDYMIGSYSIDGTFDEDLVGKQVGDEWVTAVAMPEDYYDTEVAGKSIEYNVKLLGAYQMDEFNDEFVQKYLSEEADSADAYRQKLADDYYKQNLRQAITDSISNNCVILQYPDNFVKNAEKIAKQDDKNTMQQYASYGYVVDNPWELYGFADEAEYEAHIHEQALETTADALYRQAIFNKAGLTNTEEEVKAFFFENGHDEQSYNNNVKQYGYNYLAHAVMMNKVVDYLMDTVTITE